MQSMCGASRGYLYCGSMYPPECLIHASYACGDDLGGLSQKPYEIPVLNGNAAGSFSLATWAHGGQMHACVNTVHTLLAL